MEWCSRRFGRWLGNAWRDVATLRRGNAVPHLEQWWPMDLKRPARIREGRLATDSLPPDAALGIPKSERQPRRCQMEAELAPVVPAYDARGGCYRARPALLERCADIMARSMKWSAMSAPWGRASWGAAHYRGHRIWRERPLRTASSVPATLSGCQRDPRPHQLSSDLVADGIDVRSAWDPWADSQLVALKLGSLAATSVRRPIISETRRPDSPRRSFEP